MASQPLPVEFGEDARWLVQAIDPANQLVRLTLLDSEGYRAASFLDDRMFQAPVKSIVCGLNEMVQATNLEARRDARWIFHIGHVGSTLIARLLGELAGVLSIREPRVLRDLAELDQARREGLVPAIQRSLSRTFDANEVALIKATSFVTEIAPELVPAGERALFLLDAPRTYIETILAGENSRKELRMLAGIRARRMSGRVHGLVGAERSDAHLAAAAWACEATAMTTAAEAMPDACIYWARFEPMLNDMAEALSRLVGFFGFTASSQTLQQIASGPLMRRYSKALEYEYSPALRRELLAEARHANRSDIDQAMIMLDKAACQSPYLESALSRSTGED